MERFAFGAFDKVNPAGSALNNLERTVGDLDTEKLDKSIAYQAGNMAGYMGQYTCLVVWVLRVLYSMV